MDIPKGRAYRYDPLAGTSEEIYAGGMIGGFTIQSDGALLLFMEEGLIRTWRNGELSTVREASRDLKGYRFNDVIADPAGRVELDGAADAPQRGELFAGGRP